MPRKQTTLFDPRLEAIWLAYEVASVFSKPALVDGKTAAKILGFSPEVLQALADARILMPAADARGVVKKYVLKQVICLRGDESALQRIRKMEVECIRKKNARQSRKRESAGTPDAPS